MTIYLVKGFLDVAATSLADAQALFTALLDPSTAANSATIDRVMAKLETLVQSDTGEPLVLSSIDDAAGTISSWVTDSSSVAVGIGDPDPHNSRVFCSLTGLTISGSTRIGTLALNTTELQAALSGYFGRPGRANGAAFTLHIQTTAGGTTETRALLAVQVRPAVLTAQPTNLALPTFLTAAQIAAGYQPLDSDLTAIAALATTSYGRSLLTLATARAAFVAIAVGTDTNDSAAAGSVGEFLSTTVAQASTVAITTATVTQIASVSLTAGDWDVTGAIQFIPQTTTMRTRSIAVIFPSVGLPSPDRYSAVNYGTADVNGNIYTVQPVPVRISIAATTIIYLNAYADFSGGTLTGFGFIQARRVR